MVRRRKVPSLADLAAHLANKLRPPFGVVLGSPAEVADLAASLPEGSTVCFQVDLFQAGCLHGMPIRAGSVSDGNPAPSLTLPARICTAADLWDLPEPVQTLIYPVPRGGERELKLDMIEQAFHALAPHGTFVVLSPYERDDFFPRALKKVFGKVHSPMGTGNAVFWCQREGDRPRRRHEMTFHVRVDEATSYSFVSRPGVFSYGRFDDGARALTETMVVNEGDRVLDIGCGVGTNGILAARQAGEGGSVTFVDSNLRAVALTELNARNLSVPRFETIATATLDEVPKDAFKVVLANPPYYGQLSIAQLFIERGWAALKRGGCFYLVTKQAEGVYPMIAKVFGEPEAMERRGYIVFKAQK